MGSTASNRKMAVSAPMPDNPLWMFRPFLSPAPLPLEVISQLQEPMKALQMWLFFSLLLVGAIFDCQKRLIPNTLCALITMVGLLVFHPAQLMGPLAALPLLAAAMVIFIPGALSAIPKRRIRLKTV